VLAASSDEFAAKSEGASITILVTLSDPQNKFAINSEDASIAF
jgi:hypothetical protein